MKVFVSGSKKIEYLNEEMKRILDKLISKKYDILIGDCIGVDLEVQEYLKENIQNLIYENSQPLLKRAGIFCARCVLHKIL